MSIFQLKLIPYAHKHGNYDIADPDIFFFLLYIYKKYTSCFIVYYFVLISEYFIIG